MKHSKLPLTRDGRSIRDNMGDLYCTTHSPVGSTAHFGKVISEGRAEFIVKACNAYEKLKDDNAAMLEALETRYICRTSGCNDDCELWDKCDDGDYPGRLEEKAIAKAKGE